MLVQCGVTHSVLCIDLLAYCVGLALVKESVLDQGRDAGLCLASMKLIKINSKSLDRVDMLTDGCVMSLMITGLAAGPTEGARGQGHGSCRTSMGGGQRLVEKRRVL